MGKIKSLEELGMKVEDLQKGQRIGITGKIKRRGEELPILIIADFDGKYGTHLNLSNCVSKHIDVGISTSPDYEIGEVLNLIYNRTQKVDQISFMITQFKDPQYFMLPSK